jgi:hypothetical protein
LWNIEVKKEEEEEEKRNGSSIIEEAKRFSPLEALLPI